MKYTESDLIKIAKRENNNKRNYLLVDPLQGKHVPVSPSKALNLFTCLADTFRNEYNNERLLLIGFAETATAIGAQVAISIGAKYIQTTREEIQDVEYLFFSEEHSHATEQKLVKNDLDSVIKQVDRIVFIEDEVSTGNTILNIIKILDKEYAGKVKYSVASIINGMEQKHLEIYKNKNIPLHYLLKTDNSTYKEVADTFLENGRYYNFGDNTDADFSVISIMNKLDARRVVSAKQYESACERLWLEAKKELRNLPGKNILVLGTEEFMFPAIYIGKKLEEEGNFVLCHSTTRSPISVSSEDGYPLHSRYELKSVYDSGRRTFIYDIGKYDKVLIVTDACANETKGVRTLINAIKTHNDNITLIRWC